MAEATPDLDVLLSEDYVDGIGELPIEDLRNRKGTCERFEWELSYLRRLVHGRLDIINAELRRREGGSNGGLADIVDHLPEILSEGGRGGATGRRTFDLKGDVNHRLLTADLDRIIDVDTVASLPSLSHDEIGRIAEALVELEQRVSAQRRLLHGCLDTVQAEIVRRYKSGEVSVDSLLP